MIDPKTVRDTVQRQVEQITAIRTPIENLLARCEPCPTRDRLVEANAIFNLRLTAMPGRVAALGPFKNRDHLEQTLQRAVRHVVEALDEVTEICREATDGGR